jgi:hypothetical protein
VPAPASRGPLHAGERGARAKAIQTPPRRATWGQRSS